MTLKPMFEERYNHLLQSLDVAHSAYYVAGTFGGPSLYFHVRALEAGKNNDLERFTESVYAVLAAWGMHRMGPGGSKMLEFEEFQASLKPLWSSIRELQKVSPDDLGDGDWKNLEDLFYRIRCMKSGTSLVGNSKVLAHALPNLLPPVDRQYTLRFLYGHTRIANGLPLEWATLKKILSDFFYPIAREESFRLKATQWQQRKAEFRWDTSPLKIIDNLVIGLLKL